jgi:hypothetical protein
MPDSVKISLERLNRLEFIEKHLNEIVSVAVEKFSEVGEISKDKASDIGFLIEKTAAVTATMAALTIGSAVVGARTFIGENPNRCSNRPITTDDITTIIRDLQLAKKCQNEIEK